VQIFVLLRGTLGRLCLDAFVLILGHCVWLKVWVRLLVVFGGCLICE